MRKHLLIILNLLIVYTAFAQTTKISGKVYDASTNEVLPFVNVVIKGTTTGTTTDFDGNYTLSTETPGDSVIVSYVGYLSSTKKIIRGKSQTINFSLNPSAVALKVVEIKPGENPAHYYLRKIWEFKPVNDRDRYDAYQYEVYNKLEFDINNLNGKFKNNKLVKPFDFALNNVDSSNANEKPFLPVFLTESISDIYYKKKPRFKKEVIKASKTAGFQSESVSAVLGDMYQNVNVYDNNILVFGKNFVSPVSTSGLFFYRYYLVDSMFIDDCWTYQIKFIPKRKQELTFDGNFWVNDTTFALKRIEMRIAPDANINFVNGLYVVQEYERAEGKYWMLKKDKLVVDFTYQNKAMGLYGRKTTTYKDIKINKPKEDDFYSKTEDLIVEKDALGKDEQYWIETRHDTLSKNEKNIYKLVDTIKTIPLYRTYESLVQLGLTGYKMIDRFNKIEFGPVFSTYSFNQIEGHRFRLGGRTSYNFSHTLEFNAYVAYGTWDERFKYGAAMKWKPKDAKKWQFLTVKLMDDNEILGQNNALLRSDNLFVSLFRRRPLTKLTRIKQFKATYDYEVVSGFLTRTGFNYRDIIPIGSTHFNYRDENNVIQERPYIRNAEATLVARFAYKEKYIDGDFTRVYLGTKSPVLQLQANIGFKGILGSHYDYQKLALNITDRVRLQPLGYTDYSVEYGKIFGKQLPYVLLELHPGNESYGLSFYSYNLMNYFEFVSDNYYSFNIDHHFEGFFLNKIPLMRKLKFREVVNLKGVAGTISKQNQIALYLPENTHSLSFTKPYLETSVGLENILKFFRVDAIFRLNYLDRNVYKDIAPFGIKATAQLIF